jgi:phosphoglycolate phosphatase-like HAD superfamily hydrolase
VTTPPAAILDIDGTLVDTNYQHAVAWFRAFRRLEVTPPLYRIHRHIGMGGDQLVGALAGDDFERAHGRGAAGSGGGVRVRGGSRICWRNWIRPLCLPFRSGA